MQRRALLLACPGLLAAAPARPAAPSRPVRVTGSSMALTVVRRIADAFATGEEAPGPVEVPQSLGSTGALRAIGAGLLDLAILSRPVSEAEAAAGYSSQLLATTPLVLVSRRADPARTLSAEDVARILSGELARWPDGAPLRFVRRQPSDGDWDLLEILSPAIAQAVPVAKIRPGVVTSTNDADHAAALERLPGAVGLLALGQVAAEGRALRPVPVGGVTPDIAAMRARSWPLAKEIHVARHARTRPEALAFEAFLRGPAAAAILAATDHLPVARALA